jgi:type III pantothenate kinase
MRLLIDAGNTRIKWALTRGDEWLCRGALPTERAAELSEQFADGPAIRAVWASNVAGAEVGRALREAVVADAWHFVTARERQCGVRNGYEQPAQLGSDRWAALIAAWHLVGGCCLVVNCGTATTVDALSDEGEFLGGLILPGVELMQRSLWGATAQLEQGAGKYVAFPRNTADALFSGAVQATCGAVERQHALLDKVGATVVLSGGAAEVLRERLKLPLRFEDNLVLQGLWLIARETKA